MLPFGANAPECLSILAGINCLLFGYFYENMVHKIEVYILFALTWNGLPALVATRCLKLNVATAYC